MPAPIIPWQPCNIPSEIQEELNRRKTVRSFDYVNNQQGWSGGDWNKYKGPMTSWIRITSNGEGFKSVKKPRFVLYGGKGFYQTYGFSKPTNISTVNQQIIGYTPEGVPHVIENDIKNSPYPIHVATPEVSRVETKIQKELFRRTTIEWVCFSYKQLEYMTPYFLVPGITCMVEWGWNHFNPASLVNIQDTNEMQSLWNNAYPLYSKNIIRSKGNYEVIYGYVTNFNWSMENNTIVCSTEITSKDRLYAGVIADQTLRVRGDTKEEDGQLISIKQFMNIQKDSGKSGTTENPILQFKSIAQTNLKQDSSGKYTLIPTNIPTLTDPTKTLLSSAKGGFNVQDVIDDILVGINSKDASREKFESSKLRISYLYGIFCGRDPKLNKINKNDFDNYQNADSTTAGNTWINMGLLVEILNHFSQRPGIKGEPMWKVDITTTVIGGHPNLMSTSQDVLIPSYIAPKYFYGELGDKRIADEESIFTQERLDRLNSKFPYFYTVVDAVTGKLEYTNNGYRAQYIHPTPIENNKANAKLSRWFYQGKGFCYRNDIDIHINEYRYAHPEIDLNTKSRERIRYSFPSSQDLDLWNGQIVEKDRSGLLSNIYFNFGKFRDIVSANNVLSLYDIYTSILSTLNQSVDGFWDLQLVEAEGKLSVVDKKYTPITNFDGQNLVYDFSYYDTDSLIKTFKFRPHLHDAQATRVIYGGVNNAGAKYNTTDAEDMLNYNFKDAVINPHSSGNSYIPSLKNTRQERKDQISAVQTLSKEGMRITVYSPSFLKAEAARARAAASKQVTMVGFGGRATFGGTGISNDTNFEQFGGFEIKKLILPDAKLLRELLDDEDYKNNGRYCAIQPGILAELILLGIGGIRTFQYFRIRNLPQPYSHKNIIFRITDVTHSVVAGNWETKITAGILPLRDYIKDRLGTPKGGW